MLRRFISILMSILLLVGTTAPTFAADNSVAAQVQKTASPNIGTGPIAVLTADDGTQIQIQGVLQPENQLNTLSISNSLNTKEITYKFSVPAPTPRGSGSSTVPDSDTNSYTDVFLTIYYNFNVLSGQTQYLLTAVSGYWVINTPNVSVESAELTYSCSGVVSDQMVSDLPVSNHFNVTTNFTTYHPKEFGAIGANLTLHFLMGTSRRWTMTVQNNQLG